MTLMSVLVTVVAIFVSGPAPLPQGPSAPPPASAGHSLVFATGLQMVLLVNAGLGGGDASAVSPATRIWGWTGKAWQLMDASGPPVRNLAGVAFDTRRNTLVMHGGTDNSGRTYDETWEWSRGAGWRRFTGPTPGALDHTQMAYDEVRGRSVLFGGSGTDPNVALGDTWEFDGTRWERVTSTGPAGRVHHAMQYDPGLHRVVVFGGFTPGGRAHGDTWSWDGATWTTSAPTREPRTHARMAYDGTLGALLVAGGTRLAALGVLVRRDAGWRELSTSTQPTARHLTDIAYDASRKVLVLFGGGANSGGTLLADTWEFDGTTWRQIM